MNIQCKENTEKSVPTDQNKTKEHYLNIPQNPFNNRLWEKICLLQLSTIKHDDV